MRRADSQPILFPLLLVGVGVLLLLNNYLLLEANLAALAPLLLVLIALNLLWRGDLAPSWAAQTFGITRGNVESAALEVSSGELDVRLRPLLRTGRLIAGQYTARSRPRLLVRQNQAALILRRGETWLLSLADWDLGLATDVPWRLLVTSHLGQIQADLSGVPLQAGILATGIGDIRAVCPLAGRLTVRSAFGDISIFIPTGVPVTLNLHASPLCRVSLSPQVQRAPDAPLSVTLYATFGNIQVEALEASEFETEAAYDDAGDAPVP